jgi:cytochrome c-type biogenesis protein CcmH
MIRRLAFLLICLIGVLPAAFALSPEEILPDPALEARARALSKELRCMVCQNQSIDDSDAQLAKDLRVLVRERLVAGDSDAEILDFIVERYGEFALLRPRVNGHNVLLWGAPILVLLGGALWLLTRRRPHIAMNVQAPLDADEEAALQNALSSFQGDRKQG